VRLLILAVGNRMPEWVNTGFEEYAKRMPRELRVELVEIKPEKRGGGKTTLQIMEAERDRILQALPGNCVLIALDEHGSNPTTQRLAQSLRDWMQSGGDVAFAVGGADGLHEDIKKKAAALMALSAMTLPHGMVRVILAEQLYRAYSVIKGHPYHRE
jgi:23S rRNA (pseudouridine1915-N3)-methyltransferase